MKPPGPKLISGNQLGQKFSGCQANQAVMLRMLMKMLTIIASISHATKRSPQVANLGVKGGGLGAV